MSESTEWARVCASPTYFRTTYYYSTDQHDRENPVKLVPNDGYLRVIDGVWNDPSCRFVNIVKSRQMKMSIALTSFALWDGLTHAGANILFQSDVLEKAAWGGPKLSDDVQGQYKALLSKVLFAWLRLPEWMRSMAIKTSKVPPVIIFGHEVAPSYITAISSDFAPAAGSVLTRMFADEISLQPQSQESFNTAKPALSNSGFYCALGTIYTKRGLKRGDSRGFQYRTAFGLQRSTDKPKTKMVRPPHSIGDIAIMVPYNATEVPGVPGMWWCRDARNGFLNLFLHYSADPSKDRKWAEREKEGCTEESEWLTNYELQWDAIDSASHLAFPSWCVDNIDNDCCYDPALGPVFRYNDFARTTAVIFAQQDRDGQIRIFDCIEANDILTFELAEAIVVRSREKGYGKNFNNGGDPAGRQRNSQSRRSDREILLERYFQEASENGANSFSVEYHDRKVTSDADAVAMLNLKIGQRLGRKAGLVVNAARCPGVAYALAHATVNPATGALVDNDATHLTDDVKYLVWNRYSRPTDIIEETRAFRGERPISVTPEERKRELKDAWERHMNEEETRFEQPEDELCHVH